MTYWRRHLLTWALPLGLLVVNLLVLGAYRVLFADRVGLLRQEVGSERQELTKLAEQRRQLQDLVARAEHSRDGIADLYQQRFATESERLTTLIREVKDLATRAGLRPTRISYPERELGDYGLIERSIVFSVEGDYLALRRFVNFLELTDSFIVLRSIQLREAGNGLSLSLQLSTLFSGRDEPAAAAVGGAG